MAAYGDQLVALDVNTPQQTEMAQGQADEAMAQSQLTRATNPAMIQLRQAQASTAKAEAGTAALTLQQQQQLNAYRQHMLSTLGLPGDASSSQLSGAAAAQTAPSAPSAPSPPMLFSPGVQEVMQSIDPDDPKAADKFDTQMRALSEDDPQAGQFVGNYSRANLQNWRAAIGAHSITGAQPATSPLATAAAPGPASPLAGPQAPQTSPLAPAAPVSPITGAPDHDLAAMAVLDPEGTGKMLAMQGMIKYQQTGDPAVLQRYAPDLYAKLATASKDLSDAQKTALTTQYATMGQQANGVLALAAKLGNDAPEVRAAYDTAVLSAAKNGWISPALAQQELTGPIDFARLAFLAVVSQTVTESMTSSGQTAAAEARAKAANPEPQSQYIGVDARGRPIYHEIHAPPGTPDTVGNLAVNAKPSAGAATFETKQAAYLQVHPGDTQGAIEFANGQRTLPPGEAAVAARAAADREQANAALTGQPFDANAAYQAHLAEFEGQGAAPAPGAPGPAGTPRPGAAAAPARMTPQQIAAARPFTGAKAAQGTAANPSVPINERQYNALPKGAVYIRPDGSIRTKQ